jgi:hypothetical protein
LVCNATSGRVNETWHSEEGGCSGGGYETFVVVVDKVAVVFVDDVLVVNRFLFGECEFFCNVGGGWNNKIAEPE